jgi:LacI family transcriptional regulator
VVIGTPLPALCKELMTLMIDAVERGDAAVPGQSFLPFEIFISENI